MLISDEKKFLFVHVPKTGGSSLKALLKPHCLEKNPSKIASVLRPLRLPRDYHRFRFLTHGPLLTAEQIMPDEVFRAYFKFAFVRNPWDRLVSEYNAVLRKANHRRHRRVARLGFAGYLRREAPGVVQNQVDLLTDSTGKIAVDFVGRFENFANDVRHVCEHIGIACDLPHANSHPHEHYRTYYDDDTRAFVQERWAADIAAFGYAF